MTRWAAASLRVSRASFACTLLMACSSSSADSTSPKSCSSDAECSNTQGCYYAQKAGCDAVGSCLERSGIVQAACKAEMFCGCDGSIVSSCTAPPFYSPVPLNGDFPTYGRSGVTCTPTAATDGGPPVWLVGKLYGH